MADARILDAAVTLLLENGYRRFNVDEVATRATVAKTTLYRRWPTKDHLAVEVIAKLQDDVPIASSGDLTADLTGYLARIAEGLNAMRQAGNATAHDPRSAGNVAEIAAAVARHPDLGEIARAQFAKRNAQAIDLIAKARDENRLNTDVDPKILFDQLSGALYYRVLLTGDPIDPHYVRTLVSNALSGLLPPKGQSR